MDFPTTREKKKVSSSLLVQDDNDNQVQKQVEGFVKQDQERSRGLLIIKLARKNQWAKIKSLEFVVVRAHLKQVDNFGNTALYYAAMNQNYEMCKFLLEKGAHPNQPCELRNTPFHCAFMNGSKQVL